MKSTRDTARATSKAELEELGADNGNLSMLAVDDNLSLSQDRLSNIYHS